MTGQLRDKWGNKLAWLICTAPGCPREGEPALVRAGSAHCSRSCGVRGKPRPDVAGSRNHNWAGDDPSYQAMHQRIAALRGKPAGPCEHCGTTDLAAVIRFEWAFNHVGNWQNPADYLRLCMPCHRQFDAASHVRGEQAGVAKLTASDVREIRKLHAAGTSTTKALAARFGVSDSNVVSIIRRKTWAWLDVPDDGNLTTSSDCCDQARMDSRVNPRHLWSAGELEELIGDDHD